MLLLGKRGGQSNRRGEVCRKLTLKKLRGINDNFEGCSLKTAAAIY